MARPYRDKSNDDAIRKAYGSGEKVEAILAEYGLQKGTFYRIVTAQRRKSVTSIRLTHENHRAR